MDSLVWDDLRFFLGVARHGTLSAAGKALRVAQPTVGRRLAACERRLGARLFERLPSGMALTQTGRDVLRHVERMESEVLDVERTATGRDDGLKGIVRITASEWLCARVLAAAIAPLLERNAGLSIELIADARHLNLIKREADIAVRPTAFRHQTMVQRRIGRIELGLYAAPTYLARTGDAFVKYGDGHAIISLVDSVGDIARPWLDAHAKHARVVARTNGREQMAMLAAAGVGIACLPVIMGEAMPGLRRLEPPAPLPTHPLWLGVQREVREVPRVRAAMAALTSYVPHRLSGTSRRVIA